MEGRSVILKQYFLSCLAHASYLVADEDAGVAAVVDPQRDVDEYVTDAEKLGVAIRHVILTHFHADFVAGHLELRARTGATIHLGARARADYAFEAWPELRPLILGPGVLLEALETPGHTPEGISILVFDLKKDARKPHAVLTGDTLFVGDVGRPDLMASEGCSAEELAGRLHDSIHRKLLTLPDETLVYPAHGAGSACGKNLSKETVSTIGAQRAFNLALRAPTKEAFVRLVTSDQPSCPPYFPYDSDLNRRERPTLDENLERVLVPLTLGATLHRKAQGAQLVDVRDPADFEGGHVVGSLNVGLGGKYATWAGTVLDRERPIVILAEPGREREAALRLGRIGFDRVAGYLDGGPRAALEVRPELTRRTDRISAPELAQRLASGAPLTVLDVRAESEWKGRRIAGSTNVPLDRLRERISEVPRGPLVVHCQSGYRSSIAASILELNGVHGFSDLEGGIASWEASRLPTVVNEG